MDQRIIDLYDKFTHGALNRREFLDRLAALAGSAAAALALLPLLQSDYARAETISENDPRLVTIRCTTAPCGQSSRPTWRAQRATQSARR